MNLIARDLIRCIAYKLLKWIPDQQFVQLQYLFKYNRFPNLDHPNHISEYLNQKKLKSPAEDVVRLCDKAQMRSFIEELGLSHLLMPTLDVVNSFKEINWNAYPFPYIVKVSNASSFNVIVKSHNELWLQKIRMQLFSLQEYKDYAREKCYEFAPRSFVVEPFSGLTALDDYKLHCFNGKVKFTQINLNSSTDRSRVMLNEEFKVIDFPFVSGRETRQIDYDEKQLSKMKSYAERIAQCFDFVRVDFYDIEGVIKIGEITLFPNAGYLLRKNALMDQEWYHILKKTY
jgi:hypothetical protein